MQDDETPADTTPQPDQPDPEPTELEEPDQPSEPEELDKSEEPEESEEPAESDQPDEPEEPKKPAKPGLNISWTASESIDHERGVWWYVIAVALVLIVLGLDFYIQHFSFSSISIAVLTLVILTAILTVSRRPARELHYTLTDEGLTIENQLRPFSEFSAFGVRHDGALWQLVLIPVQRFGLGVTMFINEDQGEAIVDALGARLPMENLKNDLLDKLIRKLKI